LAISDWSDVLTLSPNSNFKKIKRNFQKYTKGQNNPKRNTLYTQQATSYQGNQKEKM
jgi:hypothetical protein